MSVGELLENAVGIVLIALLLWWWARGYSTGRATLVQASNDTARKPLRGDADGDWVILMPDEDGRPAHYLLKAARKPELSRVAVGGCLREHVVGLAYAGELDGKSFASYTGPARLDTELGLMSACVQHFGCSACGAAVAEAQAASDARYYEERRAEFEAAQPASTAEEAQRVPDFAVLDLFAEGDILVRDSLEDGESLFLLGVKDFEGMYESRVRRGACLCSEVARFVHKLIISPIRHRFVGSVGGRRVLTPEDFAKYCRCTGCGCEAADGDEGDVPFKGDLLDLIELIDQRRVRHGG